MLDAARLARDGDQQADCVNIPSVIPAAFGTASACRKQACGRRCNPLHVSAIRCKSEACYLFIYQMCA